MIEIFSRKPDSLVIETSSHLTPIPLEEEISSLSAILLDDDYYNIILEGRYVLDGLSLLQPEYLLILKVKAWLDLSKMKEEHYDIDSKDIRKHSNDVFRLFQIIDPQKSILLSETIKNDMRHFVNNIGEGNNILLKNLGIKEPLYKVLDYLKKYYKL